MTEREIMLSIVEEVIKSGVDINFGDHNGNTPLHIAVATNNLEVAKLLLEKGANLEIKNKNNLTPLSLAIFCYEKNPKYLDMIKFLVESGAEVD